MYHILLILIIPVFIYGEDMKPESCFNRGVICYRNNKYEEAVFFFSRACSSDDVSLRAKALYNTGNALFRLERYAESLESYMKSHELDPGSIDCKYNIEFVMQKMKQEAGKKHGNIKKEQAGEGVREKAPEVNRDEMSMEEAERILQSMDIKKSEGKTGRSAEKPRPLTVVSSKDW